MSFKLYTPLIYMILLVSCTGTGPERKGIEVAQVVLEEVLSLGDESKGDTILFGSIDGIAVNGRGDIFVAERRPWLLSAFAADGTYLSPVGAEGRGQGNTSMAFRGPPSGQPILCIYGQSGPTRGFKSMTPRIFLLGTTANIVDGVLNLHGRRGSRFGSF